MLCSTMDSSCTIKSKSSVDSDSMPSTGLFELQTGEIRNSAPFKSKSADIFGSLEVMEQKYESHTRGFSVDEDDTEDGDKEERQSIKRGCIFQKPSGALDGNHATKSFKTKGKTDHVVQANQNSDRSGQDDRGSHNHSPQSLESQRVCSTSSLSSNQMEAGGSDCKIIFRKPDRHSKSKELKGEMSRYRPPGVRRGRGQDTWTGAPRGRRGQPADHLLNPQKYTKYSLEETDMCGNAANRSIALGFLNDLKKQKESQLKEETGDSEEGKHVFQKPVSSDDQMQQSTKKRAFGSVYKMPEYEVGKNTSERKLKKPKLMDTLKQQTGDVQHESVLHHLNDTECRGATTSVQLETSSTPEHAGNDRSGLEKETSFKSRKVKQRQFRGRFDMDN